MWLEAIIAHADLVRVLGRFLPVKIYLDNEGTGEAVKIQEDRWLRLRPPTSVELVPDQGVRVICPAEISWSLAGVSASAKIDELAVLFRPRVEDEAQGHVLELHIEVEAADFHVLPGFVDGAIVKAVNASLADRKIVWDFSDTLTRSVGLGKKFDPVESLEIQVTGGKHRITAEGLILLVSFDLDFARDD